MTPQAIVGARIRYRRKTLGLSIEDLARRCGLHWTYVRGVEHGRHNLTLRSLLKLASGLEVDAGELVEGLMNAEGGESRPLALEGCERTLANRRQPEKEAP